ncbi:hypothetical protein [Streptomyces phaeoluteigriseus]|uniref:hypothetical protein n=1 Tax=Streptomyces phaeoluteigriseus TaxID=114686 RepID=UPI0036B321BF
MALLLELQRRIPDGWFLRRLMPALLFVVVAVVGGGQLGHRKWDDVGLARDRIAGALPLNGGLTADGAATLLLVVLAAVAVALALPLGAGGVGALAAGAWPWWLASLARRLTRWRVRRWTPPQEIGREAVRARAAGRELRAARLDARRARAAPLRPTSPTWSGDRLRAAEQSARAETGTDLPGEWTRLLLEVPDASRAALGEARDAYQAACEALVWSVAFTAVGIWWWPAGLGGIVLWLVSWRSLRRAADGLCHTAEAVVALQRTAPPPPT